MTPPSVVLASASRARAAMLDAAGVPFITDPAGVDEAELKLALQADGAAPQQVAEALATAKASQVALRHRGSLVIGADQVLDLDGRVVDKPVDRSAARAQLAEIAGRDHHLHSAVCLVRDGQVIWHHTGTATLHVRTLSDDFLDQYLTAMGDAVCTTVGGYQLEGLGAQLFSRIDGDYFTILGMPLLPLLEMLRAHKVLVA